MDRSQVYQVIDGERDYQESISSKMNHKGHPALAAELLMMEEYLKEARSNWVNAHGDSQPCLNMLRKVVGLGVRCFEHYGVPERK